MSCSRVRNVEAFATDDATVAIVGTNLRRRVDRLHVLWKPPTKTPQDLIAMLADPEIEDVSIEGGTLYSNYACPSTGEIWFAAGQVPSASRAPWQLVSWPW